MSHPTAKAAVTRKQERFVLVQAETSCLVEGGGILSAAVPASAAVVPAPPGLRFAVNSRGAGLAALADGTQPRGVDLRAI